MIGIELNFKHFSRKHSLIYKFLLGVHHAIIYMIILTSTSSVWQGYSMSRKLVATIIKDNEKDYTLAIQLKLPGCSLYNYIQAIAPRCKVTHHIIKGNSKTFLCLFTTQEEHVHTVAHASPLLHPTYIFLMRHVLLPWCLLQSVDNLPISDFSISCICSSFIPTIFRS